MEQALASSRVGKAGLENAPLFGVGCAHVLPAAEHMARAKHPPGPLAEALSAEPVRRCELPRAPRAMLRSAGPATRAFRTRARQIRIRLRARLRA